MKKASAAAAFAVFALLAGGLAIAEPLRYETPDETVQFRDGPGVELAQENCVACHSADYIETQPPQMGHAFWEAEVNKMKKTYGAPIEDADIMGIADYLAATY